MNASDVGSKDWWDVIRSMPWQEAWQHLNDYRSELMEVAVGTPNYGVAAGKLTKVNAEIKRINLMTDHARFTKAMRMVLTEEQYLLVMETKKELEREARGYQ